MKYHVIEIDGEALRMARLKKRYSQTELGGLLGVSQATVSGWEQGYKQPHPLHAERILALLALLLDVKARSLLVRRSKTAA